MALSDSVKSILAVAAILLVAAVIGYGISVWSSLQWLSGFCLVLIGLLLLGAWVYEDGEIPGGLEHDPNAWASGETQRKIRLNNIVNYTIILVLSAIVIWIEVGT